MTTEVTGVKPLISPPEMEERRSAPALYAGFGANLTKERILSAHHFPVPRMVQRSQI